MVNIILNKLITLLFNIIVGEIIVLVNIEQEFYYSECLNTIKRHGNYGLIYIFKCTNIMWRSAFYDY